jgi:short subunit dehydrogenase-like uncharacterized protein
MAARPFDVVVWGASGFTGRLVCEHLARDYAGGPVRWAMAGRSRERLEAVRADLAARFGGAAAEAPILVGALDDAPSLDAIAAQTACVLSTAGPFLRIGEPVAEAALRAAAHYVDITGEVPYVARLVEKHHAAAAAAGVRLVPCCGYDSVPSDLGAWLVVEEFKRRHGAPPAAVKQALVDARGGVSGGTIASGMGIAAAAKLAPKDVDTRGVSSTYALAPAGAPRGTDADFWGAAKDPHLGWIAPFIMQAVNTRVVQRSNYLLGWGGPAFSYREVVAAGGRLSALAAAAGTIAAGVALSQTWLHPLLRRIVPAPGEGPSEAARAAGFWKHRVVAVGADGVTTVEAEVGDPGRDPGYNSTSRMVLEAALTLALQRPQLDADARVLKGGVLTPASALGATYVERLRKAGFTLEVKP